MPVKFRGSVGPSGTVVRLLSSHAGARAQTWVPWKRSRLSRRHFQLHVLEEGHSLAWFFQPRPTGQWEVYKYCVYWGADMFWYIVLIY